MTKTKKAALYIRADTPNKRFLQTLELMKYAESNGYIVDSEVYRDEKYTKNALDRPGLTSLCLKVIMGKMDAEVLLVSSPDRLTRNQNYFYEVIGSLNPLKVIMTNTKGATK